MSLPSATFRLQNPSAQPSALAVADILGLDVGRQASREERAGLGQFLTPAPTARFLASLFTLESPTPRLLDAGAGAGALTAAVVDRLLAAPPSSRPTSVEVVAYESDVRVLSSLQATRRACLAACERAGLHADFRIVESDFLEAGSGATGPSLFREDAPAFSCAILNPPYGKIRRGSPTDCVLRQAGIDCTNTYAAFLLLAARMLEPGGQLVAIVPRSFCNGPYFRAFRRDFLACMTFTRVHVFDERGSTFRDDAVLQENLVFHAVKTRHRGSVTITESPSTDETEMSVRHTTHDELVRPDDPDAILRILTDELDAAVAATMARLPQTLEGLGLAVSTGPVVDFRVQGRLRDEPSEDTVPLLYPANMKAGRVVWPTETRKPQAIQVCPETDGILLSAGRYVIVKRFTAKEERRRIVPAVLNAEDVPTQRVGIENHLNYFHRAGASLGVLEAYGLAAFLGSSLVDEYFRQFSGHTQVNASDLRSLRYPDAPTLGAMGGRVRGRLDSQREVDQVVREALMGEPGAVDPVRAKERFREAHEILQALGFPRAQCNERSGLVLLALASMRPDSDWSEVQAPLMGITPLMDHMAAHFGKRYAPNTRETVRKQTVHQFVQAGFAVQNPDDPRRAVNSKDNVYQVNPDALAILRAFGTPEWGGRLAAYLEQAGTLRKRYARARSVRRIRIQLAPGKQIGLTPGGQNVLVQQILEGFCPRFTPGARPVYVGDAGKKWAYFDEGLLTSLGVTGIDPHGKFPDVVVYYEAEGWLVLIEAVTAHGPVDPKRHIELKGLFAGSSAGLVFVTAFLDRSSLARYLRDIAWETEVWTADAPDHLIHFDGDRFLGPYEES